MTIGIYRITNLINKKQYIGQSCNIQKRICQHKSDLRSNRHHNDHLQNSWNKYGEENFLFEIVLNCDIDVLTERENFYLSLIEESLRFNQGETADVPFRGQKHTENSKIKISLSKIGKKIYRSEKHKEKLRKIGRERSVQIAQIDPNTNKIVDIYPSIASTRIIGFVPSQISMCINNKIKSHKGYIWKIFTLNNPLP